ncbi:MAG: hypothetical protein KOO61_08875 [Spirochaetales bacterium]|nr:hypothetical protein [Spirochaetales bacterium]
MDCRDMTEFMLSMDNTTDLPPEVEQHLRGCARCRREFDQWAVAVGSLRIESGGLEDSALTERVMRAVRNEAPRTEEQPTPLRNWIIVGTVLLGGVFGLRFSDVMDWLRTSFGPAIDVAMSLILGVFLTGYICMLVASNLSRVLRVFRLR